MPITSVKKEINWNKFYAAIIFNTRESFISGLFDESRDCPNIEFDSQLAVIESLILRCRVNQVGRSSQIMQRGICLVQAIVS